MRSSVLHELANIVGANHITAAVLKLHPAASRKCASLSTVDATGALALLTALREASRDSVTSFEYMSGEALALLAQALAELALRIPAAHHVLVEMLSGDGEELLAGLAGRAGAGSFDRGGGRAAR